MHNGFCIKCETGGFRLELSSAHQSNYNSVFTASSTFSRPFNTLVYMTCFDSPTRFPEQRSDKVFLVAGKYYYIRAYQKADKLGDCASVAVELPSGHFEGPIKRKHLSWKLPGIILSSAYITVKTMMLD